MQSLQNVSVRFYSGKLLIWIKCQCQCQVWTPGNLIWQICAEHVFLFGAEMPTKTNLCMIQENPYPPNLEGEDSPPNLGGGWIFRNLLFSNVFGIRSLDSGGEIITPPNLGVWVFRFLAKPKSRTKSTKEFSEKMEGVTGSFPPERQGLWGKSHQKAHPNVRQNLCHTVSLWYLFCPQLSAPSVSGSQKRGFWQRGLLQAPVSRPRNEKLIQDIGLSSVFNAQSATVKRGVYVCKSPLLNAPF